MEPVRQKIGARAGLAFFVALCGAWLGRLDFKQKVSTDVLDLLPPAEQAPEAALVRSLAGDVQVRVMLFALREPAAASDAPVFAARLFAEELERSGQFAETVVLSDSAQLEKVGRAVFERRFALLLPGWLEEREQEFARTGQPADSFSGWLAERTAARLETFLAQPEALPLQELVPADPLLLMADIAAKAQLLAGPKAATGGAALIWARTKASPFAEEGQRPVFAAIDRAMEAVQKAHGGVELEWTGVNRFAAASRARIETEVSVLNLGSIAVVLTVGCLLVRRPWKMLHLVPVILISLLGAWTATTLVFERIHVLVFVIGSLLSGVAIDYGFYLYMQPALRDGEPYREKLRRLIRPLLASCLTTVLGFSLLLFSDLPLLRQTGVFVGTGLLCALGAAILYFAQLERPFLESRLFGRPRVASRRVVWVLGGIALAVAVIGPWRLRWRDDVRDLEIPSPELKANDARLRAQFGEIEGRSVFLTHGGSPAEARQQLEDFIAYETAHAPGATVVSLGTVFPTEKAWRAVPPRLRELDGFVRELRPALERRGFTAEAFAPFFSAWESFRVAPRPDDYGFLYEDLGRELTGPLATLYRAQAPVSWFLTLVDRPAAAAGPPASLNTVEVNQLASLNTLFTRYRWSGLRLSLAGLGLVIGSVFAIYRGRRALRIAAIPAGACFFVFGVFGLLGQTLNLFHLLGAFLGVCLSHNYAIFSSETATAGSAPPVSIRLSALSTAASFGVLGFSRIPVISSLGVTVSAIVLTALLVVELLPPPRGANA